MARSDRSDRVGRSSHGEHVDAADAVGPKRGERIEGSGAAVEDDDGRVRTGDPPHANARGDRRAGERGARWSPHRQCDDGDGDDEGRREPA